MLSWNYQARAVRWLRDRKLCSGFAQGWVAGGFLGLDAVDVRDAGFSGDFGKDVCRCQAFIVATLLSGILVRRMN